MPALTIQREGIYAAATEDDFIPDAAGLVASNVAANVGLINLLIEFVDDITGDAACTGRGDSKPCFHLPHKI